MGPSPEVGWVLPVKFTPRNKQGFWAEANKWDDIDWFHLHKSSAPEDLEIGDRYQVQVTKVSEDVATIQNYNPGRNDQLLPSGSLTVQIKERSVNSYSIAEITSFPFIDTIRIYGKVPASVVSVPILAISPLDGYAVSDISHYTWPKTGEIIRVFTNQGESTVRSLEHRYEFPIKQQAPVTGVAQVQAQYNEQRLTGSIQEFETDRPNRGEIVSAEYDYTRSENIAWLGEYDDRINIGEYLPVSGVVQIKITQAKHPLTGEVIEDPDPLPNVGQEVKVHIYGGDGSSYARSERLGIRIQLEDNSRQSGRATVEITELAENVIKGRVQAYKDTVAEGDIIPVEVGRGQAPVTGKSVTNGTTVRIEENVLASGTIDVRILDDEQPLRGAVHSYRELLPEIGERVTGNVESGITLSTAKPNHGSYIVFLPNPDNYEGRAVVEITDIGDRLEGKIVEENPVEHSRDTTFEHSPFKSESSMWNITRKKR